jgi:hypothetical protein
LFPQLDGVYRFEFGIGLGEPDEIQFILFALT